MKGVRWLVPIAAATAWAATSGLASATPSAGVEAVTLSAATVDGRDYVTKQITIQPGGTTGWHWHPGRVFGVIRSGTLSHDRADCSADGVYPPGAPITEGRGPDAVHVGRNLGSEPVVMWVVYIKTSGTPLAVDAPNPGCPFE